MFIKYMITYFSNRQVVCELSKFTAGYITLLLALNVNLSFPQTKLTITT